MRPLAILCVLLSAGLVCPLREYVNYTADGVTCEGFVAYNSAVCTSTALCTAVVILHDQDGLTDYERKRSCMLYDLGYVAFAADIYGVGVTNTTDAAATHLANSTLYLLKILGALTQVSTYSVVNTSSLVVIGYGFGGTGAVDLALAGYDGSNVTIPTGVVGVASFHGGITATERISAVNGTSRPRLLLESGGKDDSNADVATLIDELEAATVAPEYEISRYGSSVYQCFTEWDANTTGSCDYNAYADRESWGALTRFLTDVTVGGSYPGQPSSTADSTYTTSETVSYTAAGVSCQGYLRYNTRNCAQTSPCPAVVIIHDYNGLTTYEQERAVMITDNLGYVSFCADIYGTGVTDLSAAALEHLNDPTLYYNKILDELEGVGATYEISRYGAGVYNCFPTFGSSDTSANCVYNYFADKSSWLEMVDFFANVFANTTAGSTQPGSCVADLAANATDAEKRAYIAAKYGQTDFTLSGITSMSAAQRATLAASITENEIINMTDQNMAYVLATASYTMALPNSATSALTFTSFGAGATKAVLGAFSTDATGFGLLGVSEPSISGGTTHFLVNVDRLDDSGNLIRTVSLLMEAEGGPNVLTVYTYNETYSSTGVDITGSGGNVTQLSSGTWYIEAPHTSAFTAVGVYASPSPAGTSDDDSDSAWYGLLALLVIPLCCLPAGLFLWKRQKEKKADELRSTTLSVDPPEIEPSGSARSGPRPSVEPDNETPSSRSRGASHESPPSSPATSDEAQPRDGLDEYSYPIPPHRPSDAHSSAPPPSPGGTPTPTTPYGTPIRGTPYEAYDGTRTYPPTPPAWDTADDRAAAPAAQSSYAFPATQAARGGYPLPPDDPAARYPRHEGPTHRTRTPSGPLYVPPQATYPVHPTSPYASVAEETRVCPPSQPAPPSNYLPRTTSVSSGPGSRLPDTVTYLGHPRRSSPNIWNDM